MNVHCRTSKLLLLFMKILQKIQLISRISS
uniref:Uncharacterized protein n=1 Tax=Arundo donax TaxID=35708 RepID=A0A0A8ZKX8_ARUDO